MISPTLAKYIDDCMWSDLLNWRDMWFWWLSLSTKSVVVGLLGEAPELLWDISSILKGWNFRRKFRFSLPEGQAASWVKTLAFIGWILIVVGVAGEWESEIRVGDADAILQDFISANLTEAQTETNRAIEFASVNELEAAKLRKDAEGLKADNLKLEAQIAPRRLDLEQERQITEHCKGFKSLFEGKRIKLVSYTLDTEAFVFAEQIVGALRASGMTVDDDAMTVTPMGNFTMEIAIFGTDSELAKKIAVAIGSSGKPIAVGFDEHDPTGATMSLELGNIALPHEVTVLVGLKMPDPNTVSELKRIISPTPKPTKP
jgi:hypothetical protein